MRFAKEELAEDEEAPRLMPGSAASQPEFDNSEESAIRRQAEERRRRYERAYVFRPKLTCHVQLPCAIEKSLQKSLRRELLDCCPMRSVSWVHGATGAGKSRRVPLAAQMAMRANDRKGVLHVLPRKIAAYSILGFYQESSYEVVQDMASVWNGDVHVPPTQREFVVLSTPVSAFHRLRYASSWQDLSLIVFDEIQVKDGLMFLLIVYVLALITRKHPCAQGVRVLLMTATPRGAAYSTLENVLANMEIMPGTVYVKPCNDYKQYRRILLWSVVPQPADWDQLNQSSKVCKALVLMTDWLRKHRRQTASILIFVAGEGEVIRMRNAIYFSKEFAKVKWQYEVHCLFGNSPVGVESDVRERMHNHDFSANCKVLFLVLTAGKGEDGWTPKANGMINCSEQIDVDGLGFLKKGLSDEVSNKQREGRVGRVADSLVLHLKDPVEPPGTWSMHYAERLQVYLAAIELGYEGEIPGLSVRQQMEVKEDLVTGDMV